MGDYGLKASETGQDVKDVNPKNLSYTTGGNQFKIHAQGTVTVTVTDGNTTGSTTINHDLAYYPACIAYLEEVPGTNTRFRVPYRSTNRTYMDIGTNTIIITVDYPIGSPAVGSQVHDGYYFIFKDPAT